MPLVFERLNLFWQSQRLEAHRVNRMSEREAADVSEEEEDEEVEEDLEDDDNDEEEEESKEKARTAAELEKALAEEDLRKQAKEASKTEASAGSASSTPAKPEEPKVSEGPAGGSRSSSGGFPVSGGSGKGLNALSRLAALSREKAAAAPKSLTRQATLSSIIASLDLNDPKNWVKVLEADPSLKNLKTLHTNLVDKDGEWLNGFVSSGGLVSLLDLLHNMLAKGAPSLFEVLLQLETMGCIRALLNHGQVLASLLTQQNNSSLERLVSFLAGTNLKLSCQILDMLAALCWINEEGRTRTLKAFDAFKIEHAERLRFQRLVHSST